jgi:hypothetical protein
MSLSQRVGVASVVLQIREEFILLLGLTLLFEVT